MLKENKIQANPYSIQSSFVSGKSDDDYAKNYKLKELAILYEVDPKTFRRWIQPFKAEIGERIGHYYSIPQVKIIFKRLDIPNKLKAA